MSQPKARIIYLNGEDTGLKGWSPRQSATALGAVLRRRGDLKVDADALLKTHRTEKGRVDFTWPA